MLLLKNKISYIFKYKRLYFIVLLPIALIINYIARLDPYFTEKYFSRGIYPIMAQTVSFITSLLPFSIAEAGVFIGFPLLILYIIYSTVKSYRYEAQSRDIFHRLISTLLALISVASFMFTTLCGVNYHRLPFSYYSGLEVVPSTVSELSMLCDALIVKANSLREGLSTDDNGVMMLTDKSIYDTAKGVQRAYSALSEEYSVLKGNYPPPKPVFISKAMSYIQITGFYTPYTCEANVNIDVPDYSIPSTMAHELTHLRGFMREDEANYLAYVCCKYSDNKEITYSGTMLALVYCMNSLYGNDYDEYEKLYYTYSDGVRLDFEYNSRYWANFEGKIGDTYDKINDTYLKANGQTDGVKSYGRMVDLLLAEFRQNEYNLDY